MGFGAFQLCRARQPRVLNMDNRQPATLGVSIGLFVIASLFVALRFISRVFLVRRVGLHDYLMLLAWVRGLVVPAGIPREPAAWTRSGACQEDAPRDGKVDVVSDPKLMCIVR